MAAPDLEQVHAIYEETGEWHQRSAAISYQAKDWPQPRRVVIKAEVTVNERGETRDNPRFVVTNIDLTPARELHDTPLETAQVQTLQRKLLKLGVRIHETVRYIWLQFASRCPVQQLWPLLLARLRAAPAQSTSLPPAELVEKHVPGEQCACVTVD